MKLSVIVPVYKAETTLHQCLDSLLAQTIGELEILLINDGSPDSSQRILDDYRQRYPDIIRTWTVENGGQGRARNLGIAMARGDYLGFVDSDDWVAPEMYETLWKTAEQEQADVVVCDVLRCYADGHTETLRTWREGSPLATAGSACDKLFRRAAVGESRFPEGLWYEDFAFSAELLIKARKTAYVPQALYYYRCGHSSTMNNNNANKNRDLLKVMELLRGPMLEAGRREDFESLILNHVLVDGINRLRRQQGEEKEQVIREFRDYVNLQIPELNRCAAFRAESRNRRLVMRLNYRGLDKLSGALLKLKNG